MSAPKEATKRMFWNADHTKFVDEGSPEAASLAAAPGDPIPELVDAKAAAKAENKMAEAPENKTKK